MAEATRSRPYPTDTTFAPWASAKESPNFLHHYDPVASVSTATGVMSRHNSLSL